MIFKAMAAETIPSILLCQTIQTERTQEHWYTSLSIPMRIQRLDFSFYQNLPWSDDNAWFSAVYAQKPGAIYFSGDYQGHPLLLYDVSTLI
ncbi:MAG: hypothetical protein MUO63_14870 [Desulfobulbaceae bacterium]|nr:hypothetical protein [Desulfobulbaceae bacterium]